MNIKGHFPMLLLTLVILSIVSVGCGNGVSAQSPQPPVKVELDVFSGRPNPTWELSDQEANELAERLKDLPEANSGPYVPLEAQLGYRGFLITNVSGGEDIAMTIRVGGGYIYIGDKLYWDKKGLEQWLIEQARAHGQGDVIDAMQQ